MMQKVGSKGAVDAQAARRGRLLLRLRLHRWRMLLLRQERGGIDVTAARLATLVRAMRALDLI